MTIKTYQAINPKGRKVTVNIASQEDIKNYRAKGFKFEQINFDENQKIKEDKPSFKDRPVNFEKALENAKNSEHHICPICGKMFKKQFGFLGHIKTHKKSVNIIVVKYNTPDDEFKCLESVIKHTSEPYELTVIQNFSRDESLSKVWNDAIKNSKSPIICLLNSDTIVTKNWLEPMVEALGEADLVGPVTNKDGNGTAQSTWKQSSDYEVKDCYLTAFCWVFKKETWKKLNGFDEKIKLFGEDDDFIYRLVKDLKGRAVCQLQSLVYHYHHASIFKTTHKNLAKIKKESIAYLDKKYNRDWRRIDELIRGRTSRS